MSSAAATFARKYTAPLTYGLRTHSIVRKQGVVYKSLKFSASTPIPCSGISVQGDACEDRQIQQTVTPYPHTGRTGALVDFEICAGQPIQWSFHQHPGQPQCDHYSDTKYGKQRGTHPARRHCKSSRDQTSHHRKPLPGQCLSGSGRPHPISQRSDRIPEALREWWV